MSCESTFARFVTRIVAPALLAAILALALPGTRGLAQRQPASRTDTTAIKTAPAFTGRQLAVLPAGNWPTNGGNTYNQRYSPASRITKENVADLKAMWRVHLNGSGVGPRYSGQGQPLVHEGTIYASTGANDVFAVDLKTGRLLWQYAAGLEQNISTVCCGWTNRGVALGDGKVYVGQLDGKLVALDQKTGAVAWSTQAERWQDGYTITAAPLYIDGLVITGFAGAEMVTRGRVKAFSAKDGSLVWTFYTIPGPGEKGHDTWPQDSDAWQGGGGSIWQTPAADPALGLIYFQTGNPNPDFNGSARAGDNLFTSSIVAIEAKTGKYRWHFQEVHHDIWDYDAASPVILFDVRYQGRVRKALGAPGKTGWVYILDRVTGKPLVGIEEKPVLQEPEQKTAATQPFPIGDSFVPQEVVSAATSPILNNGRIFTPFWKSGAAFKPGPLGGSNWPTPAYSPKTGLMYVCANDMPGQLSATDLPGGTPQNGAMRVGGRMGRGPGGRTTGVIAAMDVSTNRKEWVVEWPNDMCMNALSVSGGGLLFVGRNDGRITALDADNGRELWGFQTDAGVSAPASIVDYQGTQYVVVFSAGTVTPGSVRGDSIWLFSLDGTMGPTEKPSTVVQVTGGLGGMRAAVPETAAAVLKAVAGRMPDPAAGKMVYTQACTFCHGPDGKGGAHGPAFTGPNDVDAIVRIISDGAGGPGGMPKFGLALKPIEIHDVAGYVLQEFIRKQ